MYERKEKRIKMNGEKTRRELFADLGIDGSIILKRILNKQHGCLWIRFIWIKIETNGRLLRTR
jgi:hypothetical protein